MFSRGQRLDWFDSGEIVIATLVAGLALYVFCVHSLTSERPFVRLKLLADRNYSLGLILVTLFGMLNFATVVLMPPLLQQHAGYPDSAIGEIVGFRGLGSGIGFLVAMPMARLDPRISLGIGALLQASTGVWMMSFDLNVDMHTLILSNILQGISIGVSWVPLTVITFWTLSPAVPGRGHVDVSFAAQLRLEPVHFDCRGGDRAHLGRELRAHGGARLALQPGARDAVGHGQLGRRFRTGARQAVGRDRTPIGADRLYECLACSIPIVALASLPLCLLARLPKSAPGTA